MSDVFELRNLSKVGNTCDKLKEEIAVIDVLIGELKKELDDATGFSDYTLTCNTENIYSSKALDLLNEIKMQLSRLLTEREKLCEALNGYNTCVNELLVYVDQLISMLSGSETSGTTELNVRNGAYQSQCWICVCCGSENTGEFCRVCGSCRQDLISDNSISASQPESVVLSDLPQSAASVSVDEHNESWFCVKCGYLNRGAFCNMCGSPSNSTYRPYTPPMPASNPVAEMPACYSMPPDTAMTPAQNYMPYKSPQTKRISKFKEWFSSHNKEKKQPLAIDSVNFSAISPNMVTAGRYLPINIVMYEDEYRSAVEEVISSYNEPLKESKSGNHKVERDSVVKVVLSSKELHIDDDTEEGVWNGKYLNFEFAVKIPSDIIEEQILLTASVYINDVPATKLKLIVDCNKNPGKNITVSRKDISSAFVSYASQDRKVVTAIVQGMEKARPDMKVFLDVDDIRSGQRWKEELEKAIDNSDVLFLCWSQFAKESAWVDFEWRYALKTKGEEAIEPVPIVTPDKCPPPPELEHKHFNDRRIYIIEATKA